MKKSTAVAASAALTIVMAGAPVQAVAQSSGSNGSRALDYQMDPNDPSIQTPDKPALGSAYTGSAPLSVTLAVLATAVSVQLIVDSVPQIRQAVDNAAVAVGLEWAPGSSEGNRIFDVPAWLAFAENLQLPALNLPAVN